MRLRCARNCSASCPRTTWKIRREVEGDANVDPNPALENMVPVDGKKAYDIREVILKVVDFADFLEVQSGYATNIVVGFARVPGRTVGIIANQPAVHGGRAGYQRVQ